MFALAIILGIYSYLIFILGIIGLLYPQTIMIISTIFFFIVLFKFKKDIAAKAHLLEITFVRKNLIFFVLLALLSAINLLGTLGPETSFDALWYHLTLPKIYLFYHEIVHIPGGLLYYSDMPKLAEMVYIGALSFGNEILANFLQFVIGLVICSAVFQTTKKFLPTQFAIFAVLIFYGNLVVDWESTTAYIDLFRTLFEFLALVGYLYWTETKNEKWIYLSAIMIGFAITTKLLAIGSLIIFLLLVILQSIQKKENFKATFVRLVNYLLMALLFPLPWFIFSYVHTGNPVYPFFTHTYPTSFDSHLLNPFQFIHDCWILLTAADDPISPIYLIFLPLLLYFYKKLPVSMKQIALYSGLGFLAWYITPRTGGGRFIIPYLPAFSIVVSAVIYQLWKQKEHKILYQTSVTVIVFVTCLSIIYRAIANARYIPVIFGKETKQQFLTTHLNFSFGDFYDTDNFFTNHIHDTVLLYGFHNLYYVDFPFIDSTWVKKGDSFKYIATQNTDLPKRFTGWKPIYKNATTYVTVYENGDRLWRY